MIARALQLAGSHEEKQQASPDQVLHDISRIPFETNVTVHRQR